MMTFTEQDKALITELNLQELPEDVQIQELQSFYRTLRLRIGMALEDKLSDEQLIEFEKVSQAGDQEAANAWMAKAVPDYDQVVKTEMEALKQEIKKTAAEFRSIVNEEVNG